MVENVSDKHLKYVTVFRPLLLASYTLLFFFEVKKMVTETMTKFQRELKSLHGLAVMNMVFGGIALSLAISIGVPNILTLVEAQNLLFPQLALVALGLATSAISLRWLISSAEILDGADDIKDDYDKKQADLDDEGLTGLIVKMIAYYRKNKPTIKTMILISRIAGGCFLISGTFNLATAVTNMVAGVPQWDLLIQTLGAVVNFAMATASLTIPHFFAKYSETWDYRLEKTTKAEKELRRQLEEE